MIADRIKKYISPIDAGLGGVAQDGMRLYIRQAWWHGSSKSYFIAGLYIEDSVRDNSVGDLEIMFDRFTHSPWYPVGTGATLEEALDALDQKLELADNIPPLCKAPAWYASVFQAAFQFTECSNRDALYEFDSTPVSNPLNLV